ncbi:MAG: hypothetical protein M3Z08_18085 [Chloroflexota bacterium]|nr:hypothetical protein [Chloroflexota bacterium]
MFDNPMSEQECQQDTMRHVQRWIDVLEERIIALLQANELHTLKPGERELAVNRHLVLVLRLLKLRQQYAGKDQPDDTQAGMLEAILHGIDE